MFFKYTLEDEVPSNIEAVSPPVSVLLETVDTGEIAVKRNDDVGTVSPQALHSQDVQSLDKVKVYTQNENKITITSNTDLELPKSEVNIAKMGEGTNADSQRISSKPIFVKPTRPYLKMEGALFGSVTQNTTPSTIPVDRYSTQQVAGGGSGRFPYRWPNYNVFPPLISAGSRIGGLGLATAGTLVKTAGQASDTAVDTVKDGSDWIQANTQFIKDMPFVYNFHKPVSNLVNTSLDTGHVVVGDTAENVGNSLSDIGQSVRKRNDGASDKQSEKFTSNLIIF